MHLRLVAAGAEFAELFFEWRHEAETVRFNPMKNASVAELRERLSAAGTDLTAIDLYESFFWMIQVDGVLAGHVSLNNVNKMMKTSEIGYGVASEFRGKGVATRAVHLLAERFFAGTDYRKLIAFVHEGNISSHKVLEKIGFKAEGLLREQFLIQGAPANEVVYGLLRRDLKERM